MRVASTASSGAKRGNASSGEDTVNVRETRRILAALAGMAGSVLSLGCALIQPAGRDARTWDVVLSGRPMACAAFGEEGDLHVILHDGYLAAEGKTASNMTYVHADRKGVVSEQEVPGTRRFAPDCVVGTRDTGIHVIGWDNELHALRDWVLREDAWTAYGVPSAADADSVRAVAAVALPDRTVHCFAVSENPRRDVMYHWVLSAGASWSVPERLAVDEKTTGVQYCAYGKGKRWEVAYATEATLGLMGGEKGTGADQESVEEFYWRGLTSRRVYGCLWNQGRTVVVLEGGFRPQEGVVESLRIWEWPVVGDGRHERTEVRLPRWARSTGGRRALWTDGRVILFHSCYRPFVWDQCFGIAVQRNGRWQTPRVVPRGLTSRSEMRLLAVSGKGDGHQVEMAIFLRPPTGLGRLMKPNRVRLVTLDADKLR
jgi:hypothetical protein